MLHAGRSMRVVQGGVASGTDRTIDVAHMKSNSSRLYGRTKYMRAVGGR